MNTITPPNEAAILGGLLVLVFLVFLAWGWAEWRAGRRVVGSKVFPAAAWPRGLEPTASRLAERRARGRNGEREGVAPSHENETREAGMKRSDRIPKLAAEAAAHMNGAHERELKGQLDLVRERARRVELLCRGLVKGVDEVGEVRGLFALRERLHELDGELGALIGMQCEAEAENVERGEAA